MIKHNKIPVHVSIDLETLDTKSSAVIVSVGLAAFTVAGGLVATHYSTLKRDGQTAKGRTESADTLNWWAARPASVKEALNQDKAIDADVGLRHVASFFDRFYGNMYYVAGVWGFGSDFDNAILIDAFGDFGMDVPWDYKANRCGRTLVRELGTPKPPAVGVHHNALDDAIWQANWFAAALRQLAQFRLGT